VGEGVGVGEVDDLRGQHGIEKRERHIDPSGGLADLLKGSLAPPVLREIVGNYNQIFRDELVARATVRGYNTRKTVAESIKHSRSNTRTVHFVQQRDRMIIVVIAPKPCGLLGKNIIVRLAFVKGQVPGQGMGSRRLSTPGRANHQNNDSFVRAGLSLNTSILSNTLVITKHRTELRVPKLLAGTLLDDHLAELDEVATLTLFGLFTELNIGAGDGGLVVLGDVREGLRLGAPPGLEVKRVAVVLEALEEGELQNGADGLGVVKLDVALEVVRAGLADLLLAGEEAHLVAEVGFAERERGELGVVEREDVVTGA
jgi:hypothetical protein